MVLLSLALLVSLVVLIFSCDNGTSFRNIIDSSSLNNQTIYGVIAKQSDPSVPLDDGFSFIAPRSGVINLPAGSYWVYLSLTSKGSFDNGYPLTLNSGDNPMDLYVPLNYIQR